MVLLLVALAFGARGGIMGRDGYDNDDEDEDRSNSGGSIRVKNNGFQRRG